MVVTVSPLPPLSSVIPYPVGGGGGIPLFDSADISPWSTGFSFPVSENTRQDRVGKTDCYISGD